MIGPLEILIVVAILLVIFGARFLPKLGREAGKGARIGKQKGKELAATVSEKANEIDTREVARTAGEHVREARDLRDTLKGETSSGTAGEKAAEPAAEPASSDAGASAGPNEAGSSAESSSSSDRPG